MRIVDDLHTTRRTVTITTTSIAANASYADSTALTLSKAFVLYSIQTSRPARVRIYGSVAASTADASRQVGVDPSSSTAVILDYVTTDTATHALWPLALGSSVEATPVVTAPVRITNNDTTSGTVAATLTYVCLE